MYELTKREKKIAREIIDKGLQIEYTNALNDADNVIQNWKNKITDNREAYHLHYKTVKDHDKHIARRYDGMRGSSYIYIIAAQLADKIISKNDLKEFREEIQNAIIFLSRTEE